MRNGAVFSVGACRVPDWGVGDTLSRPTMPEIARAETVEANRYRNAAATTFYRRAKLYGFLGKGVAALLALAAPVAILVAPSAGPTLGAIAAGWLFLSRIGL